MKKIWAVVVAVLMAFNAGATEIDAEKLNLTPEQNQKLTEMKANLKAEIEPIWEEIQASRERMTEIEKRYFEEFWNMLTEEQRAAFAEQNQK